MFKSGSCKKELHIWFLLGNLDTAASTWPQLILIFEIMSYYFLLPVFLFNSVLLYIKKKCLFLFLDEIKKEKNKYAIHAYTHGPVTGSGSSVVTPISAVWCCS